MKDVVRRAIRSLGWELSRWNVTNCRDARALRRLEARDVNLVFDVGANVGQFAMSLWNAGYRGRIVSFEPLTHVHQALERASRAYAGWEVAPRMAIGRTDDETQIHVAENSVASSLLNMLDAHRNAAAEAHYVRTENVPLRALDSVGPSYIGADSVVFLKIDAQGYEAEVLAGASAIIRRVVGLQLELSLTPLYEGERTYDEMLPRLKELGFELWGIEPGFVHPESERLLQVDVTLFRP